MEIKLANGESSKKTTSALLVLGAGTLGITDVPRLLEKLSEECSIYLLNGRVPKSREVLTYTEELKASIDGIGLKRATVLGIGAGGGLALALADACPKFVRRLVLLDTASRIEAGVLDRVIDRLEAIFPLGLPLRRLGNDFDARPLLHRIHCPTLVLQSRGAGEFLSYQARSIAQRVPNAWFKELTMSVAPSDGIISAEAAVIIEEFLQVAAKRPQKNLAR